MKAGILTPSISRRAGGLFDAVRRLSGSLNGLEGIDIVAFGLEDEDTFRDLPAWGVVPVHTSPVWGPRLFGYSADLGKTLSRADLDLLHVHGLWMYPSLASLLWSRRRVASTVISPHGMLDPWAVRNSRWKKKIAGWLYEYHHLSQAACLHSLCAAETAAIRSFGLKNPVCQIPNGIDLPEQACNLLPPWHTQIDAGQKVLLYLGRIHPKKGLANLIAAWAKIVKRDREGWVLGIAGWDQGGHEAELKKEVSGAGLSDSIFFLGPQFDAAKSACYAAAEAFILPSFSEGLPMVILEAWAHGLPVIMTPQCNLSEGFVSNAAIRVEPNQDGISQGLLKLFSMSDAEKVEMGKKGIALVKSQFTWQQAAIKMKAVYEWLLGGGDPPEWVRHD